MAAENNSRVLIVEDSQPMLNLIRAILLRSGFEVLTARNGTEAMETIGMHEVDLVISDINMPEMDGFQLCTEIRKHSHINNVPFIFLSARGSIVDKQSGFEGGADDYITKPFEPSELVVRVTALLKRTSRYRMEAYTDSLTMLNNRRYFDKKMAETVSLSNRYKEPFCVAMIDIDYFKAFNDEFGHIVGDQVLMHLSRFMRENLRSTDFCARYGGEEFVVIMPKTDKKAAYTLMNRFRKNFSETPLEYDGNKYPVTISIGVSEYPLDADSSNAVIQCADDALYKSKTGGRNLTTAYDADKKGPEGI